jgi:hypothetical protein
LAKSVHSIRADLPIILVTGYTATLTPARVRPIGIRELILKPLSVAALGMAVSRVLIEDKHK